MRRWQELAALAALLLGAGVAAGDVDLAKIERSIAKEPQYQKAPHYCLAVFGPEAAHRMWIVKDGDTFYVDRNGNGDLTEADERIEKPKPQQGEVQGIGNYSVGDLSFPQEKDKYKGFQMLVFGKDNDVYLMMEGKYQQFTAGQLRLTDKPADAPIVRFDGPLTFGHMDALAGMNTVFRPGEKEQDLRIWIGSQGGSPKLFTSISNNTVPATAHPVAEIAFPHKTEGGTPIVQKVVLKHRC
jgi:hypothetical protein